MEDDTLGEAIQLRPEAPQFKERIQKVKETTDFHDLINNDNPYTSNVAELPRGSIFLVIFEPIRNIKFSRSVYKVTSFLDFTPYVTFFENFERYIKNFLEDVQDPSKVDMIRDPTKLSQVNKELLKYFPGQLNDLNCSNSTICVRYLEKLCYQWYISTCMNRQHYEHMLSEVEYLPKVYKHVKTTFFQAINHVGNRSENNKEREPETVKQFSTPMTVREARHLQKQLDILGGKKTRVKRFFDLLATGILGYGVYTNRKDIETIKKNIQVLKEDNARQGRNINLLIRHLRKTISRVRQHDVMLRSLSVRLIRLKYSLMGQMQITNYNSFSTMILRDASYTLSRLLAGLAAASQNAEAVYSYLRVMSTHRLDPTVIPIPQLIELLEEVEEDIKGSPRLALPIDPRGNQVEDYYKIIKITPHIIQDLLVVMVTIPLTDISMQMNVYQVHNLPAVHPKLNVSVTYELEGKYLAVGQDEHYLALPSETDLSVCLATGRGLCKLNQALYPSDRVNWCVYALYKQDQEAVNKHCTYNFQKRTGNLAQNLGGYLWAISSLATEKLQVRCLKETHIEEIRPPLQIVYIGDGCEGYSPSLATTARTEITTSRDFIGRPSFFIQFNKVYQKSSTLSLWNQISLESLTEKEAAAMVQALPELEQLKLSDIDQNIGKIKGYSFHLPQWVYLVIIIVSVLAILVSIGIIIWKVYSMRGAFKEVKTLLGDKPDVGKVVKAGKFVKNLMTKDASYESSPRTKDVREPPRKNLNTSGTTRIFRAIEEEFADNPKRAQKYLNKLKTSKLSSIPESKVETDS